MKKLIKNNKCQAAYIIDQANRFWLTGFNGTSGTAIVKANGEIALFVDSRYTLEAANAKKNVTVIELSDKNIKKFLQENDIKKVVVSENDVTIAQLKAIEAFDLEVIAVDFADLRAVKTAAEIRNIQKAANIADKVFDYVIKKIKLGMSENKVAGLMYAKIKELGGDGFSFDPIVAFGANSAKPHHRAGKTKLETGNFIKLDFGVEYNGYCSDMTRTFMFGEKAKGEMVDIYFAVKETQELCVMHAKPGITFAELEEIAFKNLEKHGYKREMMGHGLGHGIGINVHEFPRSKAEKQHALKVGQVITIEPGLYLEGIGGVRIEDDVLITETGCKVLTHTTKDLVVVNC